MREIERAQFVEVKLQRAQSFFAKLDAQDVSAMRSDPQIAQHMAGLARTLMTLASAVGPEIVSLEDAEGDQ
jgi:hypothetical protein